MKEITKTHRLIVLGLSIATVLFATMLPLTGEVLRSESAYAGAPNQIWYLLMHFSMTMLFFFLNAINKNRKLFGIVAFASLLTVAFDMYGFKMSHNISTAILFLVASYCMIFYTLKENKLAKIITISVLAINFAVAVALKEKNHFVSVYLAEIMVQSAFGAIVTRDVYRRKYFD